MRLAFWRRENPAQLDDVQRKQYEKDGCVHSWSNWSAPQECAIRHTSFGWMSSYKDSESIDRSGYAQERHCLRCNLFEKRLV
jgi:hypothetical protein